MAQVTFNVLQMEEEVLFDAPRSMSINSDSIKYAVQSGTGSKILYYDEQKARLVELLVSETPFAIKTAVSTLVLVNVQRVEASETNTPMLLNPNSEAYNVALSSKDALSLAKVAYSNLAGGTFTVNDILTGSGTLATVRVVFDDGTGFAVVHPVSGVLATTDSLTSSDGSVTADVDTYTAADQHFIQYDNGHKVAGKLKDMVVEVAVSATRAITDVDLYNNTFTIAGNHQVDYIPGTPIFVDGSTGNDGMYTVVSSFYDGSDTVITVLQSIPDSTADGDIKS